MLLRKVSTVLSAAKIIDASWIWTEPHSKRIKMNVDVERSVLDGKAQIRQKIIIEFIIKAKQCMECIREATDHSWETCVQIRQRVGSQRGLDALEQMLIAGGYYHLIQDLVLCKEGIDLFFKEKQQADRIVEFLGANFPTRAKASKKLVSKDSKSNVGNYEYTILLEIAPICKGDLVLIGNGSAAELRLVHRVTSNLRFVSPLTALKQDLQSHLYFAKPFTALLTHAQLVSFIVLDINVLKDDNHSEVQTVTESGEESSAFLLAEAEVVRESDLGTNDLSYRILTHLGHILKPGDSVLGYDLEHSVVNDMDFDAQRDSFPDIVLVRKEKTDGKKGKKKPSVSGRRFKKKKHEIYGEKESLQLGTIPEESAEAATEESFQFDEDNTANS